MVSETGLFVDLPANVVADFLRKRIDKLDRWAMEIRHESCDMGGYTGKTKRLERTIELKETAEFFLAYMDQTSYRFTEHDLWLIGIGESRE